MVAAVDVNWRPEENTRKYAHDEYGRWARRPMRWCREEGDEREDGDEESKEKKYEPLRPSARETRTP